MTGIPIYLEAGAKRTFASAVDWPGWSRSGRNEDEAIAALVAYADRYGAVVPAATKFKAPEGTSAFTIVKRLKGGSGTDFGVPSLGLPSDKEPIAAPELERLTRILDASWSAFDRAAKSAKGLELRKGPRGGGRDLNKMAAHVVEADQAYIVQLGARPPKTADGQAAPPSDLHAAMLDALRARARGLPVADPSRAKTLWTPRYFARRVGWHVLDHAWEIEDRAIPRS
ncbi:MAG: DinB family protein [Candidatus Limnocylindria bacterium]